MPGFRAGQVYNFWQDDVNVRGLVRRTSVNEYRKAAPQWDVVLDVDALSKAEGANWVYQGAGCLQPDETKCLVSLSEGGKDAVEIREFDNTAKTFVVGGFRLPAGKQNADWLDADTLYVSRDFGPGTMTESGYPFVVKKWARGSKWEDAVEVYRGKARQAMSQRARVFGATKTAECRPLCSRATHRSLRLSIICRRMAGLCDCRFR